MNCEEFDRQRTIVAVLRIGKGHYFFELPLRYRGDGESAAFLKELHSGKFGVFADLLERIGLLELSLKTHVDAEPNGLLAGGAGFEILAFGKLGFVRKGFSSDPGNADDARNLAVGMVKKNPVAFFHIFRHEIARLVIADSEPRGPSVFFKLVDRVFRGFGLHKPIAHVSQLRMGGFYGIQSK